MKSENSKKSASAPAFLESDKEGLRIFLRQQSDDQTNAERLGLSRSDMENWEPNEQWLSKIEGLTWSDNAPKRLIEVNWSKKKLEGTLDASKWSELTDLYCSENQLTALDVSTNTKLTTLLFQ